MNERGTLAQRVDYRRMAIQQRTVAGVIRLQVLPRLLAVMAERVDHERLVEVELVLREDDQRRVRLSGWIKATLSLCCQRCLRTYEQVLAPEVAGVVVADDKAAANVPHADEPILAAGDWLDLYGLVSDELLLALPPVARCARVDCRGRYEQSAARDDEIEAERQPNPFAVLKALKRDD